MSTLVTDIVEQEALERVEYSAEAVAAMDDPAYLVCEVMDKRVVDLDGREWRGWAPCHDAWFHFQLVNKRSMILAPRGHGKSTICTVAYSLYKLLNNPSLRILIISNTDTQAVTLLGEIKQQFEAPMMQKLFGDLRGEPWHNHRITVSTRTQIFKEASVTAMGAFGPVIMGHYDIIIIDDAVDERNAKSEVKRRALRTWYMKTLLPTLEPGGELHVLGTRWHPLDLYNDIIKLSNNDKEHNEEDPYEVLIAGAIQDEEKKKVLCRRLWPYEELERRRQHMGSVMFNMQYQNDVELAKGAVFKPEWLDYWENGDCPDPSEEGSTVVQCFDLAISSKDSADYFTCTTVLAVKQNGKLMFYVIDQYRERGLSFAQQLELVRRYYTRYQPSMVGIESNAYQMALTQAAQESGVPVLPIFSTRDKVSRGYAMAARFENGQVLFRRGHNVQMDCVDELLEFPDAEHDDLFDSLEMCITLFTNRAAPVLTSVDKPEPEPHVPGDVIIEKDLDEGFEQPNKKTEDDKKLRIRMMDDDGAWR